MPVRWPQRLTLTVHVALILTFAWMTARLVPLALRDLGANGASPISGWFIGLEAVAFAVTVLLVLGLLRWVIAGRRRLIIWADAIAAAVGFTALIPVIFMDVSPIVGGSLAIVSFVGASIIEPSATLDPAPRVHPRAARSLLRK